MLEVPEGHTRIAPTRRKDTTSVASLHPQTILPLALFRKYEKS
ncbi:hypothetical protein ACWPKO_08440 [Coraliomargarita sp. W4R53]